MRQMLLPLLCLVLLAPSLKAQEPSPTDGWYLNTIGTGVIGWSNIPNQLVDWLSTYGDVGPVELHGTRLWPFPNLALEEASIQLLRPTSRAEFYAGLESGPFTHVILEMRPCFYTEGYGTKKGAGDVPDKPPIRERVDTGATVVPCVQAEMLMAERHPDVDLWIGHDERIPDHPEAMQAYLYLCTYFAALTGRDPRTAGLPLTCTGRQGEEKGVTITLDAATAKKMQTCAWDAWQAMQTEMAARAEP